MRALRRTTTKVALDRAAPEPLSPPAPGWAIVRPTRVGVSASDLAPAPDAAQTITLGSEFVGVV